jgi:tetratricopeptide (TPR) repeat protein
MRYRSVTVLGLALLFLISSCTGIRPIPKLKVPAEQVVRSYRLVAEGDKLIEEGKDHLALLKYLEAADLNPYHEVIFNKLAITYSRLFQYPQAKRAVERSIGLNPKYSFAYNTLGIVQLAEQNPKAATRSFHTAIQLSPKVASFYVNLGHAYMQRHKFSEARDVYRKALQIDPNVFTNTDTMELTFPQDTKPDPERPYQMAIFFADAGDKASCLHYLSKAFAAGFTDRKRIATEEAFEKFRQDQDFIQLLESYGLRTSASR